MSTANNNDNDTDDTLLDNMSKVKIHSGHNHELRTILLIVIFCIAIVVSLSIFISFLTQPDKDHDCLFTMENSQIVQTERINTLYSGDNITTIYQHYGEYSARKYIGSDGSLLWIRIINVDLSKSCDSLSELIKVPSTSQK